jgi:glutathione S-transferase
VIEGVDDLANQFFLKAVMNKVGPAAKENYLGQHWLPQSARASATRGAHAYFLSRLLGESSSGWFVESGMTVADILVAVVVEMHLRLYPRQRLEQQLPNLLELYDAVLAQPRIQAYRSSEQHLPSFAPMLP